MPVGPRELRPNEIVQVAEALTQVAPEAGIDPATTRMRLNIPGGHFAPGAAPLADWLATVRAAHAGVTRDLGYRADAVARLVDAVAQLLPANESLARLAFDLGAGGPVVAAGQRAIFLGYASTDRAEVDALHDALAALGSGIAIFQDHRSIAAGQDWLDAIRAAAGRAAVLACWVTRAYLGRTFCSYEIGIAESRGAKVVPIWVDGQDPASAPGYLSRFQGRGAQAPHDFPALATWLAASV